MGYEKLREEKAIEESGLKFHFLGNTQVVKFDESPFYREYFNKLPESKGVDILADSSEIIQLIEIKNCSGHETENMWRTSINNRKRNSAPEYVDVENRDSLDIEVAKKVVSSIVCMYGAWSNSEKTKAAVEMSGFWKGLANFVPQSQKPLDDSSFLWYS